ncbi:hypothetical protein [Limnobacter sp. P1]|uniref:hypothetical protein n=1 Tax=Limnobacter olei TaxID=3031298 RepID=UPI0023B0B6DA|nr:hypothetical protein [Limnobacter sp. P1]
MMERRKIQIAKGSLEPTRRILWLSALEKLQEAKFGLEQMTEATDRIVFEEGWTRSVDSIAEFWVKFYSEGKGLSTKFPPWVAPIEKKWRKDPLLSYLYQARHQSQHGKTPLGWEEGVYELAPDFNGHIRGLTIFEDGTYIIDATPAPGSIVEAVIRFQGGDAFLPKIFNAREKKEYEPPASHLNIQHTKITPVDAVKLAISYYSLVLDSAIKKFRGDNKFY